jgi:hypothetical protein
MHAILATQEAEIMRISVRSQPWQIVHTRPYLKKKPSQNRADGVVQGVSPKFKNQYHKKKKKIMRIRFVCSLLNIYSLVYKLLSM